MEFRNCYESDIDGCAKILSEAYAQPPYNEKWELDHAIAYLRRFYKIDPALCFVAEDGAEVIGAIFAYSYPWHGGENCYIQEIFVSPGSQGLSIGKGLINKLSASKSGSSTWLVANENAKAIDFYKSLGFSNNGPYKFFYGPV
ncbi:MAG: GNAT family N-acetyltransferase [Flavobacteriales bacterium]|nr:GNAT family N-acetyltransferase [Flavobacteriales bacterium]